MEKIDVIDKTIAELLREDGRMSSSEIARRLENISERVVRNRLERLIEQDIIRVSAVPNPRKLGYSVIADVKVQVEPGRAMDVARKLAAHDCVTYVGCSIGEGDIGLQLVAHDNEELYQFVTEVIGNVPGVSRTTTMIVPVILKDIYQWSIPDSVCADTDIEE